MIKLFLDTEFNGFGGDLISIALVPENDALENFYHEFEVRGQLDPWVRDNVVPHLTQSPTTKSNFQMHLSKYLMNLDFNYGPLTIVADWPDDIRYFCESLITGPGERINMPSKILFEINLNISYNSEVPHNALHDALAIRKAYKEIENGR